MEEHGARCRQGECQSSDREVPVQRGQRPDPGGRGARDASACPIEVVHEVEAVDEPHDPQHRERDVAAIAVHAPAETDGDQCQCDARLGQQTPHRGDRDQVVDRSHRPEPDGAEQQDDQLAARTDRDRRHDKGADDGCAAQQRRRRPVLAVLARGVVEVHAPGNPDRQRRCHTRRKPGHAGPQDRRQLAVHAPTIPRPVPSADSSSRRYWRVRSSPSRR